VNQGEAGIDCGGPCIECGVVCDVDRLDIVGATASSIENPNTAARAVDGNLTTRWSSAYTDPQWLQVDLGEPRRVKRVVLYWEAAASADYDIQISDSASGPWTTIHTDPAGNGGVDDLTELNGIGRYVRLYSRARTTTWGNSLFEFEVYGDLSPQCGPPPPCPNGTLDEGEECDDGNNRPNDGCFRCVEDPFCNPHIPSCQIP
jgi:cysteine-rich repeat protein